MTSVKKTHDVEGLRSRLVDFSALRLQVAMDLEVRGKTVQETIANIEKGLELSMPIESAKEVVAEFHELLKMDKRELLELIWKSKLGVDASKWQLKAIIDEAPERLSFHNEEDHAVIHLLSMLYFKQHNEAHVANDKIFLSHMRYLTEDIIRRMRSAISENDINAIVDNSFYLGFSAAMMASSSMYCSDLFQEAVHSSRSASLVSEKKHKPEKEKYDRYVREYAVRAWGIGCELLHTQMAQLIVDGLDDSVTCKRLKSMLAKVAPVERTSGASGVKKLIEACPCPKRLDCPIGQKFSRGERFELLAKCRKEEE